MRYRYDRPHVWRRLYKKLGRPNFDPINRGSNKGSKKFELGDKLDHHFKVKFHGESNGDGPDVQKRRLKALLKPKIEKFKI